MTRQSPYWVMLGQRFSPKLCAAVAASAEENGWQSGTYETGELRDNVSVSFMDRNYDPAVAEICAGISRDAAMLGELFDIHVDPDGFESVQVSRWRKGDHYAAHQDHDPSRQCIERDRKLSYFVQLENAGGLGVQKVGDITCQPGGKASCLNSGRPVPPCPLIPTSLLVN